MILRKIALILYYGVGYYLPDSYFPVVGGVANAFRIMLCRRIFRRCGKVLTINRKAYFGNGSGVEIGDNSGIGAECHLPHDIRIGNGVLMAPEVLVFGDNHNYSDPEVPIYLQGKSSGRPVRIGDNVWIGQRAIITAGRSVASGTVVAAGAVVTHDFEPVVIIGGNPARVIRNRCDAPGAVGFGREN